MEYPISVAEMAERYRKCASASIYDTLDRMGLPNQCLSLGIKPLTYEMRVAGPAFTVRGTREPRTGDELPQSEKFANWGMFKAMFPGCVVVVNAEKEDQTGHWGEMMSYTARQHGATGVVIDGGIRDLAGLLRIPDWPVFVRYTSPIESAKRWRAEDFMTPIYMTGTLTQSVRVNPGDWIVGDADGVMVIPQEIAYEVLLKVEELEEKEENTRRELAAGVPVEEVFAKYGRM
ncbi:MAG: RraA family protein [Chloroflexi bacterium]|nr:RraA family protein [Chloroflexota bacterium]